MDKIFLLLRQRKLLYILQHQTGLITGAELARQLGATARTIRSDVAAVNRAMEPYRIKISSYRSKGYRLTAEDSAIVQQLLQAETAFLTKEDRLRYLAFQLCLTDGAIRTDELEDEMFVSHGTLENDLHDLTEKYVRRGPRIKFRNKNNRISFEQDERKRRMILSELYYEHWNYNERSNAFYNYEFLDEAQLDRIINLVPPILHCSGIRMEDSNLVNLNLACAIMLERITSGHVLPSALPAPEDDAASNRAALELADALEQEFRCVLPREERDELRMLIHSGKLLYAGDLNFRTARSVFEPVVLDMADAYLEAIRRSFGIDFAGDEDFYITLLQMINYLQSPFRVINGGDNPEVQKRGLLTEMEFAWLFQRVSQSYTGRYLNEVEILTLAECMSGALEYQLHHHPEAKLRAVICCHMPLAVAWAMKRKILGRFGLDLAVTDIIPVNAKSAFDFSGTNLIFSTVRKPIVEDPSVGVLVVSPQIGPEDIQKIEAYVQQNRMRNIIPSSGADIRALLGGALWHEEMEFRDIAQAVEFSAAALVGTGIADVSFADDIRRRLALKFHVLEPGILFLPSTEPAEETRLSIVLLQHRALLKKCKIRAIITAAFRQGEQARIFDLGGFFHRVNQSVRSFGEIRSKADFLSLFQQNI